MKILKYFSIIVLLVLLFIGSCLFYAFKIEPYRLTCHEYTMTKKIPDKTKIKIVQFSDVHIKEDFTYQNLDQVVSFINRQTPDIVVFTGDLYDNYDLYHDDENISKELQKINATYGKIAIWGNRDYGSSAYLYYETIMNQSGFVLLKNENKYITVSNQKKILFTGLDDSMLGSASIPDVSQTNLADYNILLSHEPDIIDALEKNIYDLILSGHSHGGQVNVPFLPIINKMALSATAFSHKYTSGMYQLDEDSSQKIYVNTGIGTTHVSARFGVMPEIAVFSIYL